MIAKRNGVSVGLFAAMAFALAGLTCWAFDLDPLPDWHRGRDPGWLANLALSYFVVALLVREAVERLRR